MSRRPSQLPILGERHQPQTVLILGGSTEGADQVSAGGGTDWLDVPADSIPADSFNLMDPFQHTLIPLDSWVTHAIDWVVINFRPVFQGIRVPIDFILSGFEQMLLSLPSPIAIIIFALIAWQLSGRVMGVATFIAMIAIGPLVHGLKRW